MISIKEESFVDALEELGPLFKEHYKEVAVYQDKIDLSVDCERYRQLEDLGVLHTVIAREDNKIIGYFVSFVQPHIHYKEDVYAANDILYIAPEHRGTGIAKDMFEFAEDKLKKMGVSVIVLHMKTHIPFEGLAASLGYDKVEYNYSKCIKE